LSELIFLLAVHNHQPVGNFPAVFDQAFRDCYLPFLREMSSFPAIKFTLHFSGPLWEYMEHNQREAWELIQLLVAREQVELLGGGFYEPILAIIPERDRQGQLKLMSDFLSTNFGVRPQGVWLAERVWEPQLAKTLSQAGYKYTLLDEEHFVYAGLMRPRFPYLTEDEGYPLVIFPIDKTLRYLIPFRSLNEVEQYFQELNQEGAIAILGDDGEKFGLWPGTKDWVYKAGWLKSFLDYLSRSGIKTMTMSEFLAAHHQLNLIYLPPASYEEMMEWVLEPAQYRKLRELKQDLAPEFRRLLRGGYFREFFLKYPESNHLHKRMLQVSRFMEEQKIQDEKVLKELYRSQCNDAYWHGVFGGLYLPHLRQAAFSHLLEAEKKAGVSSGWQKIDYDLDGKEELFYRQEAFSLILKPAGGASLLELDFRPLCRNLTNVLTRRAESYHYQPQESGTGKSIHELAKRLPENYEAYLRYDPYPRRSLIDHFFSPETRLEDFSACQDKEGGGFITGEYNFSFQADRALLEKEGKLRFSGQELTLKIRKEFTPQPEGLVIRYEIINLSPEGSQFIFGQEWNFYLLPEEWQIEANRLKLLAGRMEMEFNPEPKFRWWPLETLSQSEAGYDIIFQGITWLPHWFVSLSPGEEFAFSVVLKFKHES